METRLGRAIVALAAACIAGSCGAAPSASPPAPPAEAAPRPVAPAVTGPAPPAIETAAGDGRAVAEVVREALARAEPSGARVLVYVGATWCEPCHRFLDAVRAGELDAVLPGLRLLEFDFDRDQARLAAAGYADQYVPLFVVPGPDGRGTARRSAGAVKGPGAVDFIVPRLKPLLADP
ncbi:MAG: thioredoxin family protein [Myxococcota bacterium]